MQIVTHWYFAVSSEESQINGRTEFYFVLTSWIPMIKKIFKKNYYLPHWSLILTTWTLLKYNLCNLKIRSTSKRVSLVVWSVQFQYNIFFIMRRSDWAINLLYCLVPLKRWCQAMLFHHATVLPWRSCTHLHTKFYNSRSMTIVISPTVHQN